MKTFKDLKFESHGNDALGFDTQARMDFDNKYGVSVITGDSAYTSDSEPYEVAVMLNGSLTYDTDITDDVIGHCTEKMVTDIMKKVEKLTTNKN